MSTNAAHNKILQAIRAIPAGDFSSYGEIARRAGLPGRARMVARLLSENDDPTLPWHRVLRSDGRSAFPESSAHYKEQLKRLKAEGVVIKSGKAQKKSGAKTLDELLWAQ
jgi:methylated-DNA-protein-cysteine methyltransferase related protein